MHVIEQQITKKTIKTHFFVVIKVFFLKIEKEINYLHKTVVIY